MSINNQEKDQDSPLMDFSSFQVQDQPSHTVFLNQTSHNLDAGHKEINLKTIRKVSCFCLDSDSIVQGDVIHAAGEKGNGSCIWHWIHILQY